MNRFIRKFRATPQQRGVALVISLGFIVLLTVLVTSFLISMSLDRRSTHVYSQRVRAQELGRGALTEIVEDLRKEIKAGSINDTAFIVNGKQVFVPLTRFSSQPARLGFITADYDVDVDEVNRQMLPPTLLRVSRSGTDLYANLIIDPINGELNYQQTLLPVNRASAVATTEPSLNQRIVSAERWNKAKLLGTHVPKHFADRPPEWVYVTRDGSSSLVDSEVEKLKPSDDLGNTDQLLGRYSYVVYDIGALLDINAAGYPSQLTVQPGGPDAIRKKSTVSYADLTVLPGMSDRQSDIDALIAWRNKGAMEAQSGKYLEVVDEAVKVGFLEFQPMDSPLLSRQDLLAYFKANDLPESCLPYLTTFSRSVNAPSWGPMQNSPLIPGYKAGMGMADFMYRHDSEKAESANRNLANVRFSNNSTVIHYNDEGEAETYVVDEGDPLLQARFSLARIGWLEDADPNSGSGPSASSSRGQAIQSVFGLVWDFPGVGAGAGTSANGGNKCWNYVGSNGRLAQNHIMTLAEVADQGREPNFFELLKAAILNGSLGQHPGPACFINGTAPRNLPHDYWYRGISDEQALGVAGIYAYTLGPSSTVPSPARIPDMQIIKIGANIIDQYDYDSYPTAIYFQYDGVGKSDPATGNGANPIHGPVSMAYGIENLPYLARMVSLNCTPKRSGAGAPSDSSGDDATNTFGGWRQPEIYNPHQKPNVSLVDAPRNFEIRAYGSAITYWSWQGNSEGHSYMKGTSHAVDYYQENSDAESCDVGTLYFTDSSTTSSFYDSPMLLTTDSIPGVTATSPYADNIANSKMPYYDSIDSNSEGTKTTNHFVAFSTGITSPVDEGAPFQPFWVKMSGNGTAGSESSPITTYALGWRDASNNFHPYSYISGVIPYNYSTLYPDRSPDTRIGTTLPMKLSPDKWCVPDPRTDRFSFHYNSFSSGQQANNSVYYKKNMRIKFSCKPSNPAFVFGTSNLFIPGDWMVNNPDDNIHANYYADPDGVVRFGDGAFASADTGDGLMLFETKGSPASSPVAVGDKTVEQHARRPIILNRPFESVAELGYAFRDQPFKTLDFFSNSSADAGLLDVFCLRDNATVTSNSLHTVTAGKINPNHAPYPVLQAILRGAAKKELDNAYNLEEDAKLIAENIALSLHNSGQSAANHSDLVALVGEATRTAVSSEQDKRNKVYLEAPIRALSGVENLRTWNLMIDVIAQSGQLSPTATKIDDFVVQGECRYWLHIAIDRYTGEVVDQHLEPVYE